MLAEMMTRFLTSGLKVTRRKTLLRYRHDAGAIYSQHTHYNRLFNLGALAGVAVNNHGRDLKVATHDTTVSGDTGIVYSIEAPTPTELCEWEHTQYVANRASQFDNLSPSYKVKLAFLSNVMYNVERFYRSSSQIEIETPAVAIVDQHGENRLLALDRDRTQFVDIVRTFLEARAHGRDIAGIDIYDSWKNELIHLDIRNNEEIVQMLSYWPEDTTIKQKPNSVV